jgi:hypothetical protein
MLRGENSPVWRSGDRVKICSICNTSFQVFKYRENNAKFCSRGCCGKSKRDKPTFITGKHHSKETRKKMSENHADFKGEKGTNWKGGMGTKRHRAMGQAKYILWRSQVFERDTYTCQNCKRSGIYIMAHHIKSWAKYPQLRYTISNGLTLCKICHAKQDKYYAKFVSKEVFLNWAVT